MVDPDPRLVDLLRLVPDTPETRHETNVNNLALAREILGVSLPGEGKPAAELTLEEARIRFRAVVEVFGIETAEQWRSLVTREVGAHDVESLLYALELVTRNGVMVPGPWVSGFAPPSLRNLFVRPFRAGMVYYPTQRYLGFDQRNVDLTVLAGLPPDEFEVAAGRFDPDATERALRDCAECPAPDRYAHGNISFFGWGEDREIRTRRLFDPPAFDHLGRGGRIIVEDQHVYRTLATGTMNALIDTQRGDLPSLASNEDVRLAAEGIARLRAYSVLLTNFFPGGPDAALYILVGPAGVSEVDPVLLERVQARFAAEPKLRPFRFLAVGQGLDDRGYYTALALVHASSSLASDNTTRLPQRLAQAVSLRTNEPRADSIERVEVGVDGRTMLAKIYWVLPETSLGEPFPPPVGLLIWWNARDPLLLHE